MGDLLQDGIDLFNSGRYFEAHEAWEDLWRETAGDARSYYQGLVQAAVGLHHLSKGNRRGGRSVLRRGVEKLKSFGDSCSGIDNVFLIEQLERTLHCSGPVRIQVRASDGG